MEPNNQHELFQRNMQLIGELYPQYQETLQTLKDQTNTYEIGVFESNSYRCKKRDAKKDWIHGPENPWEAAKNTIQQTDWQKQSLFIILRPGLGYVPFTLYPNMRKGRHAQRMLLVEDRLDLFFQSLFFMDWTDVLRSDRTILLLDEKPINAVLDFVQKNPVALLPPITVMCGSTRDEELGRMMDILKEQLTQLATTVHSASQQYLQDLRTHYEQIQDQGDHVKKVVMVEPEHDYLAHAIAKGFQHQGCEVQTFSGNQRLLRFLNTFIWLVYTREHFPDILFWMNRNTLSPEGVHYLKEFPIKKILWFMDSPKRVETSKEEIEATDYYFSFDPTYLPYLQKLSGKQGYLLATAAGIRPNSECEPGQSWPQKEGPAISFVGALAAQRFQAVRAFWLRRDPEFVEILDSIVEDYLRDPTISLEERFETSPGRERLPYRGFVVLYLEERATYLRRLRTLKPLKDFGLVTYGAPEWAKPEWAEELSECHSGQAPKYLEELPGVYFHSQINVNVFHVQCVNSTNPRIYDVLAAGGFLLTEYRPMIEEEFTIGQHLDCFHTPEELRDKTEYYLYHKDKREEMARAGQEFVLHHATYRHRIEEMMRIMKLS